MDVLEIHPWGSTIKHFEEPDIIILDLDPGPDALWVTVVNAAIEVRDHLKYYKLQSFAKTTGGKGLHIQSKNSYTVATPLSWDELSKNKEENTFTIKTLPTV